MKTIKWLKISMVLQAIFVSCCIASIVCFAINHLYECDFFFSLGSILLCGWIINPTGFVTSIGGLILYRYEQKDADNRARIGYKWIWFILFLIFDTLLYFSSAVLVVSITGGI